MITYWELWENERWEKNVPSLLKLFSVVDEAIQTFVERNGIQEVEILKWRWDAPERTLVFPSKQGQGILNNIHTLFMPETRVLRVTIAAWRDETIEGLLAPRKRRWTHNSEEQEKLWSLSAEEVPSVSTIVDSLTRAYKEVSSWGPDRLRLGAEIP